MNDSLGGNERQAFVSRSNQNHAPAGDTKPTNVDDVYELDEPDFSNRLEDPTEPGCIGAAAEMADHYKAPLTCDFWLPGAKH